MQHRIGTWVCVLIGTGACSGRLAVLSEDPAETAQGLDGAQAVQNDNANAGPGGATPVGGASCDLDQWRTLSGPPPARPFDCGVCNCVAGELVCEERQCLPDRTLVECPKRVGGLFDTRSTLGTRVEGTTLHVELMGSGGCGGEDYVICYDPEDPTAPSYPGPSGYVSISLKNTEQADDCAGVSFQTFDVDLSPIANQIRPGSGLIETGFGYATFGELTCTDRSLLADNEVNRDYFLVDNKCQVDSDCVVRAVSPSCGGGGCLWTYATPSGMADLESRIQERNDTICTPFFAQGCTEPPQPDGCSPPYAPEFAPRCVQGVCGGSSE